MSASVPAWPSAGRRPGRTPRTVPARPSAAHRPGIRYAATEEPRPQLPRPSPGFGPAAPRAWTPGTTRRSTGGLDVPFAQSPAAHRLPDRPRTAPVLRNRGCPAAAGNWRRITRPLYSGKRADPHIIASHRLHHGRSLAGAAPNNHLLTPHRREPRRRRCRHFRTASPAASRNPRDGGPYRRMCSAPTVRAGRHRPCAVGLLTYPAMRRAAGRTTGGARRSGPCPRTPVGPLGPRPLPRPRGVSPR